MIKTERGNNHQNFLPKAILRKVFTRILKSKTGNGAQDRTGHNEDDEASSPLYRYNRYKAWHKKSPPDVSDIKTITWIMFHYLVNIEFSFRTWTDKGHITDKHIP